MKFFNLLEHYRFTLIGVLVLASSAALIISATTGTYTLDGFWHLRMGQDWVEQGLSPWIDHYSFTYEGQPISSPPYLFQLLLYFIVDTLGLDGGFVAYKVLAALAVLASATIWLIVVKSPTLVIFIFYPVLIALLQLRAMVRPELISYSFVMLVMILMYRARNQYNIRTMLPVLVLMVLWGNYHNPIVGYVLLFGFFVDSAVVFIRERADRPTWTAWVLWGLVIVLAGFLNPDFSHPIIRRLTWDSAWIKVILEYEPTIYYAGRPVVYILIGIASLCIGFLVKQRRIGLLVVVILLIYNALLYSRMVTIAGIITVSILAMLLRDAQFDHWITQATKRTKTILGLLCVITVSIQIVDIIYITQSRLKNTSSEARNYPYDVVEYIRKNNLKGRMVNTYGSGGFLIYQLAPDIKVFIDGRTSILYPIDHHHLYRSLFASPDLFRSYAQKMQVKFSMFENSSELYDIMLGTGLFELDYAGARHSLFRSEGGNFPLIGTLAARPACWSTLPRDRLLEEISYAQRIFPRNSVLANFLKLVLDYNEAPDKSEFTMNFKIPPSIPNWSRRFIAYRAIEHGYYKKAFDLFFLWDTKNQRDIMAASWALYLDDRKDLAQNTLHTAMQVKWANIDLGDVITMYNLLDLVDFEDESALKFQEFKDNVEVQVRKFVPSGKVPPLEIQSFCGVYD